MRKIAALLFPVFLASCDGGVSVGRESVEKESSTAIVGTPPVTVWPAVSDTVETDEEAANFLIQATYGPTLESIDELRRLGYSEWFREQIGLDADYFLDDTLNRVATDGISSNLRFENHTIDLLVEKAQLAPDQLRQRAHYALSQIFATSTSVIPRKSYFHAAYKDILVDNAFGQFRDLLHDVTYSPLMGTWLTYVGNRKADAVTGFAPDENYAREVMQLFTIGLEELNLDGSPKLTNGRPIESYTLGDVVELAKVFTGLYYDGLSFGQSVGSHSDLVPDVNPMVMHNEHHSAGTKSFLGHTVPDYGDGDQSIEHALDILFHHDNVGPFIGKQLIQRMTTSNPSPGYIARVATAFNSGEFVLPDGGTVGSGVRGDLTPVWAAILFDHEARSTDRFDSPTWGKIREPFIRQVHWQRLADADGHQFRVLLLLTELGQVPYRSPSVFNFYRPGYIAPNTNMGALGQALPEMQITTGPQIIDGFYLMRESAFGVRRDAQLVPSYTQDTPFVEDSQRYVDYLDLVYTANQLTDNTRRLLLDTIDSIPLPEGDPVALQAAIEERISRAHLLLMTSIEFMVQI